MSTGSERLGAAKAGREDLHKVLIDLERAIAAPVAGRPAAWASRVRDEVERLHGSFERHLSITEGELGLFEEIVDVAPRLSGPVKHLIDEHDDLEAAIAQSREDVSDPDAVDAAAATKLRASLLSLLGALARHRQKGADLIYEAYQVDIGEP